MKWKNKCENEGKTDFEKISTKFYGQYAKMGKFNRIILYNMLLESFGAILYTENTP